MKNNNLFKTRNSQITIFVIIGLVLVVGIALVFLLVQQPFERINPVEDPKAFVQSCVQEAVDEAIPLILVHGGYISAPDLNLVYDDNEVAYLCYTGEKNKICSFKEPMLIEKIEQEISDYIDPRIKACFDSLERDLKNYNPKLGPTTFNVEIKNQQVIIEINKDLSFTKNEQEQSFDVFDTAIPSPLYSFTRITNDIINQEIDCKCNQETCNADVFTVAQDSAFEVERFVSGRNEKIYNIREVASGQEFRFAVRNCVRLP